MPPVVDAWPGLDLIAPVDEGHRTEVWRGRLDGQPVSVRRTRRSAASLAWELRTIGLVATHGVGVAAVIPAADGSESVGGVVVQRWLHGRPPTTDGDWRAVAATLQRVHGVAVDQRPDACAVTEIAGHRRSVDADLDTVPVDVAREIVVVLESFGDAPVGLVHGDPSASNIRIDADERVWLLDWDESRVDVLWHDLSNLGVQVLDDEQHQRALRLSDAWEAVNAWTAEPAYARRRLADLRRRCP